MLTGLAEMKHSKETLCISEFNRLLKQWTQRNGNFPSNLMFREGKGTNQSGSLSPKKRFHPVLTAYETTLQGETEVQARMS